MTEKKVKLTLPPEIKQTQEVKDWIDKCENILSKHMDTPEFKEPIQKAMKLHIETMIYGTPFGRSNTND